MRKVLISMHLFIDPQEYTDPSTWDFNEILGFKNGLIQDGAKVTEVDVYDLGSIAERRQARG
jgi:hypothetical protein